MNKKYSPELLLLIAEKVGSWAEAAENPKKFHLFTPLERRGIVDKLPLETKTDLVSALFVCLLGYKTNLSDHLTALRLEAKKIHIINTRKATKIDVGREHGLRESLIYIPYINKLGLETLKELGIGELGDFDSKKCGVERRKSLLKRFADAVSLYIIEKGTPYKPPEVLMRGFAKFPVSTNALADIDDLMELIRQMSMDKASVNEGCSEVPKDFWALSYEEMAAYLKTLSSEIEPKSKMFFGGKVKSVVVNEPDPTNLLQFGWEDREAKNNLIFFFRFGENASLKKISADWNWANGLQLSLELQTERLAMHPAAAECRAFRFDELPGGRPS